MKALFAGDTRRILWTAFVVGVIVSYQDIGSAIERRFFPVIRDLGNDMAVRGGQIACWRWRFLKRRASEFIETDIKITTGDGDVVDASPLIGDAGLRYFRRSRTTQPDNLMRHRVVCVDFARGEIRKYQSATLQMTVTYQTWPWLGLWSVSHRLRPVHLPPLSPSP